MSSYRELPQVDPWRCTGCGDCVAVCPTECLEMRFDQPHLIRPRQCVSCDVCARVCPEEAISLVEKWCG
jgi:formate hydrogenlyase subunit 6/NADH:ubiquinone oxidoreductase subunit I